MSERRYTEEEIATIFHVAAETPSTPSQQLTRTDGLTLADLQAIGREVGLSPEAVAHAAQTLEVRQSAVSRKFLGFDIGVERRVTLRRRLTDDEWEQLVVHLRDVFKARGSVRADGSLRQWTNGNLFVLMEPTPTGARIRLGSRHAAAAASLRMGAVGITVATILAIGHFFGGASADMGTISGLFAGGGLLVGNGALRLPRWARLRGRQMEDIAARLALPPGSTTIPE